MDCVCGKWTYGGGGEGRSRSTTDLWIICTSEPTFRGGALRSSGRLHAIGLLGGHRSMRANVFLSFLPSFFLSFLMPMSLPACTGSKLGRPPCNTGLTQTDTYLWRKDHLILHYLLRWTDCEKKLLHDPLHFVSLPFSRQMLHVCFLYMCSLLSEGVTCVSSVPHFHLRRTMYIVTGDYNKNQEIWGNRLSWKTNQINTPK